MGSEAAASDPINIFIRLFINLTPLIPLSLRREGG
jgi:hypothetical protein